MTIVTFKTYDDDEYYPVQFFMRAAISNVNEIYNNLKNEVNLSNININVWCSGSSGDILAALLVNKIYNDYSNNEIHIHHVRKPGEQRHYDDCNDTFNCNFGDNALNIIIDDTVSSGTTLSRILKRMAEYNVKTNIICLCYQLKSTIYGKINEIKSMTTFDLLIVGTHDGEI